MINIKKNRNFEFIKDLRKYDYISLKCNINKIIKKVKKCLASNSKKQIPNTLKFQNSNPKLQINSNDQIKNSNQKKSVSFIEYWNL